MDPSFFGKSINAFGDAFGDTFQNHSLGENQQRGRINMERKSWGEPPM